MLFMSGTDGRMYSLDDRQPENRIVEIGTGVYFYQVYKKKTRVKDHNLLWQEHVINIVM